MKSAPWQSSCRAVQDRRTAQANSRHVQRLMNVKPSIDMRKPKALKYKRSRKNKQTVADVSTQEFTKTEYRTIIATTPKYHCQMHNNPKHVSVYSLFSKKLFGFRFFLTASFETKNTDLLIFSLPSTITIQFHRKQDSNKFNATTIACYAIFWKSIHRDGPNENNVFQGKGFFKSVFFYNTQAAYWTTYLTFFTISSSFIVFIFNRQVESFWKRGWFFKFN